MKITSLEEYGFRCMLLLAQCSPGESLTLPEFQVREGISVPYAAKLLLVLKQAGLVKAVRGRNGGYTLTRPPERILLKEIFDALGQPVFSSTHCDKHSGLLDICAHADDCKVRNIWKSFDSVVSQLFDRITLADIASGKPEILETVQVSIGNKDKKSDLNSL